ncbi:two -component sensor histidine kinase LytS-like protein [Psychroflexus torquis ATCC 700755]|uniref:Two-component sensor histidine kinase LytS-like protein n=1 Tax=Psychroflexus torquis (strain ATCC 700755 / CIP 106069 / ACAM 623) TaxID=313595 RepID=K4IKL5_PSYTT|nr:sensor histidine kinase [Psychroflexus torquis]AFU70348.1 two -component sensor histidine kinase LytS-like protein [Psychroflexus torquis ATCC 700755]
MAPRYLKKGSFVKQGLYILGTLLVCAFIFSLNSNINEGNQLQLMTTEPEKSFFIPSYLIHVYLFFITYLVSMPFYLSLGWFEQQSKIDKLESETLRTELDSLKNQINPHFFFNTLNNLYSLSLSNSEKAPKAILKLSELMRYVIYDPSKPYVTIQEEMDYLDNYFEIQKIRLSNKTEIQFESKIDELSYPVLPLLFINLLENAFKHGAESMIKGGYIHCSLQLQKGKLQFHVKNKYENNKQKQEEKGLINLKRRLNLAYSEVHSLTIKDENGICDVSLTIDKIDEVSHS